MPILVVGMMAEIKKTNEKKMQDPNEYISEDVEQNNDDSSQVLRKVHRFIKKLKTEGLGSLAKYLLKKNSKNLH